MFKISNAAEISAMGVECSQLSFDTSMQPGAYFDEEVMSCTVPDDFEKSKEFTIKMFARVDTNQYSEFNTEDENVKVSVEVPSEGGFGGLTEDLSEEDKQMLIYVGGGLVGVLVLLIVVLKISRNKGGGGVDAWDDEDFDFEL